MSKHKGKKYEGMGFVEALIAIMIVGISSVVLMQMSVNVMQSMIQNEVIDVMTQYAVEGSTMIQNIATQQKQSGSNMFPTSGGSCYLIQKNDDTGQYQFKKEENGSDLPRPYSLDDRESYKEDGIIDADGKYFRIFCISDDYSNPDPYAVVEVIVGQTNSDGKVTKGNNVKDYTYFTVVSL